MSFMSLMHQLYIWLRFLKTSGELDYVYHTFGISTKEKQSHSSLSECIISSRTILPTALEEL